jgi:hypothetical protein
MESDVTPGAATRKELKQSLDKHLGELKKLYINTTATKPHVQHFPTAEELRKLVDLVEKLSLAMGIRKAGFGTLASSMKRIDHDYKQENGLINFALTLAEKISKLPTPPLTALQHKLNSGSLPNYPNAREILTWVQKSLRNLDTAWANGNGPLNDFNLGQGSKIAWGTIYHLIRDFTSLPVQKALRNPGDIPVSYLGFMCWLDLHRQQLYWNLNYERQVQPAAAWLYSLAISAIDTRLRVTLHGTALEPAGLKKTLQKFRAITRQRKHRQQRNAKLS